MIKNLLLMVVLFTTTLLCSQNNFKSTWETTTPNEVIGIPTTGSGFNYDVDWEDDGIFDDLGVTGNVTHTYATAGTYTVVIRGDFPRFHFRSYSTPFRLKIKTIEQWGDIQWASMGDAFFGCGDLVINATDIPDLSGVTNMQGAFFQVASFGPSISLWDVSSVTNMRFLFTSSGINQPLNDWDVSNVTDMAAIFEDTPFNQALDNWDLTSLNFANSMFRLNTVFNQPLNNWDVSSITNMSFMFNGCSSFNQPLDSWDVSNVGDMQHMFNGASIFNQPLNMWDVSTVRYMNMMFNGASSFNRRLGGWNVATVDDMNGMFSNAIVFNQPLPNWDVSGVFNMSSMFSGATAFDQSIATWDVSNVTDMSNMFLNATLSDANYDALLVGWEEQTLQPNVSFHGGLSKYCNAAPERASIISTYGWTITDGGQAACSLGVDQFSDFNFAILPNPVINAFSIDILSPINKLTIYDLQGKTVKIFNENLESYNIENLTSGMYFVNIQSDQGKATKKLIKE